MLATLQVAGWPTEYPLPAIAAGLAALVFGADLLVRGAVWVALAVGMSRMAVGLTLVAMGTSMPELLVSFTAARTGRSEIAMANVIGSNTANVLLIVGTAAAIRAIRLRVRRLELFYMLAATALAGAPFVLGTGVDRRLAATMVAMLVLFCWQLVRRERAHVVHPGHAPAPRPTAAGWFFHVGLLAGGLALLAYGAEWLVEGAVEVARSLGWTEALIGMTVIAIGTSLPELATSVVAAHKGQPEICVGNVIGSNIFNVGAVLGIAGLLQPFPVDTAALGNLMILTGASALAFAVVLLACRGVPRVVGIVFLLAYGGFLTAEALWNRPA